MPSIKIDVTFYDGDLQMTLPLTCEGAMIIAKEYNTSLTPQISIKSQSKPDPLLGYFYLNFPELQYLMVNKLYQNPGEIPLPDSDIIPNTRGTVIDLSHFFDKKVDKPL
jgi:hypothetical protein